MKLTHELNSELFKWISANPYEELGRLNAEQSAARRKPKWRLRDRLAERDIVRLIMAYKTGIATKELAEWYAINVKSVRKVLKLRGVKRKLRQDSTT